MAKRKAGDYASEPANKKGKNTAVGAAVVTDESLKQILFLYAECLTEVFVPGSGDTLTAVNSDTGENPAATADKRDHLILRSLKILNTNLQSFEPGRLAAHREIAGELEVLRRHLRDFALPDLAIVGGEAPEEPASEIDDVEQVLIAGHRAKKAQNVSVTVSERVNKILACFDHDPMVEAGVLTVMRGEMMPGKSHAEAEDFSLGLLCSGYSEGSKESYKAALREASSASLRALSHYQEVKQRSSVMDQVADAEQRIQKRHEHLYALSGDMQAGCWTLHVMQQIEALKFAMDWARLSGQGSSRKNLLT